LISKNNLQDGLYPLLSNYFNINNLNQIQVGTNLELKIIFERPIIKSIIGQKK